MLRHFVYLDIFPIIVAFCCEDFHPYKRPLVNQSVFWHPAEDHTQLHPTEAVNLENRPINFSEGDTKGQDKKVMIYKSASSRLFRGTPCAYDA